jgi:hypothetical protein
VKITIKRTLLLILALLLMLDFAEDGFLGRATFELSHASTKPSARTPHHNGSAQVDFLYEYPPANLCAPPGQANYQPASFKVPPTSKIIDFHNTGSSGGIPF